LSVTRELLAPAPPPPPPLEDHLRPTHMCVFVRSKKVFRKCHRPSSTKLFLFHVVYEACIQKLAAYSYLVYCSIELVLCNTNGLLIYD
jgi:hypothetical protein